MELFTQKIVNKLSKIWVWVPGSDIRDPGFEIRHPRSGIQDPRSGIGKKPIPDPGSRGQKDTGSQILDPDPQHCFFVNFLTITYAKNV
jgi:hypothetical protein